MRHRTLLATCALLAVATSGCDKVKSVVDGVLGRKPRTDTATALAQRPDAVRRDSTPGARGTPVTTEPPPPPAPANLQPVDDVLYLSADTGTIAPGMTERDVYSLWGAPAAVRRAGEYTYLYFHNGCEKTCGTMDLVILENGQVIDAVVRWPGHGYSGESSSPPGRVPFPTRGDTLVVPTPPTEH